jgi:bacterioferritin-associated ferredoxin
VCRAIDKRFKVNKNDSRYHLCNMTLFLATEVTNMYICVCQGVTERQIHQAAQDGARSLKDLSRELGITRECGRCAMCARQCLNQALADCRSADGAAYEKNSLAA